MRSRLLAAFALTAMLTAGCPAVYPEIGTRLKVAPKDAVLEPGPPEELFWIRIVSATVPEKTRDGRKWDQVLGSLPDPYAKLYVNGAEIMRTTVQSDTLSPTWPDAPHGNYEVPSGAKLRVELWDSSPINDSPIGIRDFGRPMPDELIEGRYRMELKGGGEIVIAFEPAHPMFGLGMWFELRNDATFVTRFLPGSPAARAGMQAGDEIFSINGKRVAGMKPEEVRSMLNSVPLTGVDLEVRRPDGSTVAMNLKEGPIYPTFSDFGQID